MDQLVVDINIEEAVGISIMLEEAGMINIVYLVLLDEYHNSNMRNVVQLINTLE